MVSARGGVEVMADNVELPWPSARGGVEWEWTVVSLRDTFPGEILALCVREKDRENVIDVDAEPPPPPRRQAPPLSVGFGSRHTGLVQSHRSWERGRQQDRPGLWVRLPERQFPAKSAVVRWAGERLRCSEWDAWVRDLRACLPRAPPGLLERRLIQFLDWRVKAGRDLRQPEFVPLIATALSSLDSGIWESLLHDSTSPKLLMQRIRDEVFSRGLGVVGHIPIPADIWERYGIDSFASVGSRHFSGVGPPSDEAVVMLHALRSHKPLFPLPPGSPGPNRGGGGGLPSQNRLISVV